MRKPLAAALIAASALAITACGQRGDRDDAGPSVSRTYQVGNFQQIEIVGPYDVEVRSGPNVSVAGQGPQKLMERTIVEVRGDKLLIHPQDEHHGFHLFSFGSHGSARFVIIVPQLNAATLAGSGHLNVDTVKGDQFEANLTGAGDLGIGSVNLKSLKVSIAGSGDVRVHGGQAQNAQYDIMGAGDVDASQVNAEQLKVSIAGSGDIKAHATGAADVSVTGSGDVTVTGGAKCSVHKAGSGDVHCS